MHDSALLSWLDRPADDKGIRFARPENAWDFWSYARLADFARRVAQALVAVGVKENDLVILIQPSGPEFVAALFGTILAGAVPSPIAPPIAFQDAEIYAEHIVGVLASTRASHVVTQSDFTETIRALARGSSVRKVVGTETLLSEAPEGTDAPQRIRPQHALIQFTSGSGGRARGIRVPFAALEANIAAIYRWLKWNRDDTFASWLPIHHDMGLVGGLICPIVRQSDLWLLRPEQFVRNPLRYLRCFCEGGASLTAMPNFGLDHIVRRVRPESLSGLDLSAWRGLVIGAERLDSRTLESFFDLLSPLGFPRSALLPAYGLAEATLAVTGVSLGEQWTLANVQPGSTALGRRVAIAHEGGDGLRVVGCGHPLEGVSIAIVDEDSRPLADGTIGEIVVQAASVAESYVSAAGSTTLELADGRLHTRDAGFVLGGQLFVLGRLDDGIKIRGRMLFSEDVELALGSAGIPRNRLATLIGLRNGVPTLVSLLEQAQSAWLDESQRIIRRLTSGYAAVILVDAPRGTIARTSSGKPRRRHMWQLFLKDALPGRMISLDPQL